MKKFNYVPRHYSIDIIPDPTSMVVKRKKMYKILLIQKQVFNGLVVFTLSYCSFFESVNSILISSKSK